MTATLPFHEADLPEGLRFDGVMPGEGREWLQFTECDESVASHGCSFYIDSRAALRAAIVARRIEKQHEFAMGLTA